MCETEPWLFSLRYFGASTGTQVVAISKEARIQNADEIFRQRKTKIHKFIHFYHLRQAKSTEKHKPTNHPPSKTQLLPLEYPGNLALCVRSLWFDMEMRTVLKS
jgi:hypothetical protein